MAAFYADPCRHGCTCPKPKDGEPHHRCTNITIDSMLPSPDKAFEKLARRESGEDVPGGYRRAKEEPKKRKPRKVKATPVVDTFEEQVAAAAAQAMEVLGGEK
jgi:hypothetical protein